jgi:hypothetical protein
VIVRKILGRRFADVMGMQMAEVHDEAERAKAAAENMGGGEGCARGTCAGSCDCVFDPWWYGKIFGKVMDLMWTLYPMVERSLDCPLWVQSQLYVGSERRLSGEYNLH